MGEQRHYRRPSQHKRRPPQTVMPCGSEDTPERQSEHRAETEKQPPRQPRKRLVQKPTPKSRQNPPEQWAKWRGQALDSAKQCAKRGAKASRARSASGAACGDARQTQSGAAETEKAGGAGQLSRRVFRRRAEGRKTRRLNPRYAVMAGLFCVAIWSAAQLVGFGARYVQTRRLEKQLSAMHSECLCGIRAGDAGGGHAGGNARGNGDAHADRSARADANPRAGGRGRRSRPCRKPSKPRNISAWAARRLRRWRRCTRRTQIWSRGSRLTTCSTCPWSTATTAITHPRFREEQIDGGHDLPLTKTTR